MEQKVRELLNEVAADMPTIGSLPAPTRRRARRGMAVSLLACGLVIGLVAFGTVVGVRALNGRTKPSAASAPICNWTRVPSPNQDPAALTNSLGAVAVVAEGDAWAIGSYYRPAGEASGPAHPLIEHWDGSGWSIVPIPDAGPEMSLSGLAAAGADDVGL